MSGYDLKSEQNIQTNLHLICTKYCLTNLIWVKCRFH